MALLAGHTPSPYESLVYYYGIYSSSYRGKEKGENTEKKVEVEEARATGKASATWARLIHKIFEVDVLCCKKCGGEMKVIAFITEGKSVNGSIEPHWRTDEEGTASSRVPSPTTLPDADFDDYPSR